MAAFAANLRYHSQSGIDADAHLRPHAVLGLDYGGGDGEAFEYQQSRAARPQRRILQRVGRAEQRHDAVTGEVLDRAPLLPDRARHQFVDRLDQRERALLTKPLGDRGEAEHVREQHRHLPPLA